jgi:hypothetical protein
LGEGCKRPSAKSDNMSRLRRNPIGTRTQTRQSSPDGRTGTKESKSSGAPSVTLCHQAGILALRQLLQPISSHTGVNQHSMLTLKPTAIKNVTLLKNS